MIGINSALDLVNCSEELIKKLTNILGLKTALELKGISCLDLVEIADPKQSITVSRSFGQEIKDYESLKQALNFFASRAAEKLRKSGQMSKSITIFIRTNPFTIDSKRYSNAANIKFDYPTDSTPTLLKAVNKALINIYREEYSYKKAGIYISDFCPKTNKAFDLFDKPELRNTNSKLMEVIDKMNHTYGRRTIFYAGSGLTQDWSPKSNMRSACYTSNWQDIITVK